MHREFVVLVVDNISIVGQIFLPENAAKSPVVCLCHGLPSGNAPEPGDGGYPLMAENICREGFAVLIFNFRGTGESGGNIDIKGWTHDLKAVIDYLSQRPDIDRSHLALVGFSAGGAVSITVAAGDKRVSGVAACASPADYSLFTEAEPQSVVDRFRKIGLIRDKDFPTSVSKWLAGFEESSPEKHVHKIAPRPLLLIHGSQDTTVPVSHAHRLYARAGEHKQLAIIEGAGHHLRRDSRAMELVMDWLKSRR